MTAPQAAPESTQTKPSKKPDGIVEWFWRGAALREARGYRRSLSAIEQTRLAHALTALELAERAFDPVDPLKAGPSLHLSLSLYREAAYWALLCHAPSVQATTLAEAFTGSSPDDLVLWANGAETLQDVRRALIERTFVETADLPAEVLAKDARVSRDFVQAVVRQKLAPEERVGRLQLQRVARVLAFVVVLLGAVSSAVIGVQRALLKPDLAEGKPWRASSSLEACRPKERYCANAHTDIFFHTVEEKNPWFEIDLGKPQTFSVIEITNRSDCCPDRAVPLVVEVSSDQQQWREVSRRKDTFTFWRGKFAPQTARYVRVRALRRTLLHFEKVAIRAG